MVKHLLSAINAPWNPEEHVKNATADCSGVQPGPTRMPHHECGAKNTAAIDLHVKSWRLPWNNYRDFPP